MLSTVHAVYELQGPDLDGNDKLFRKPWAMATNMFIGMSFCIPLFYLEEGRQRRRSAQSAGLDASAPLLNGGEKVTRAVYTLMNVLSSRIICTCICPSSCCAS